jgi:hypothetical protein
VELENHGCHDIMLLYIQHHAKRYLDSIDHFSERDRRDLQEALGYPGSAPCRPREGTGAAMAFAASKVPQAMSGGRTRHRKKTTFQGNSCPINRTYEDGRFRFERPSHFRPSIGKQQTSGPFRSHKSPVSWMGLSAAARLRVLLCGV